MTVFWKTKNKISLSTVCHWCSHFFTSRTPRNMYCFCTLSVFSTRDTCLTVRYSLSSRYPACWKRYRFSTSALQPRALLMDVGIAARLALVVSSVLWELVPMPSMMWAQLALDILLVWMSQSYGNENDDALYSYELWEGAEMLMVVPIWWPNHSVMQFRGTHQDC